MKDHWGYDNEKKPDIVEVVRCKDCKHQNASAKKTTHCAVFDCWMKDDFFCKKGEKGETND